MSSTCHENAAYDVGHPVELIDASFKDTVVRPDESTFDEDSC